MANIYDISKLAGVSIATVSRVLNDKSKVSENTRKKVIDAMKKLDYTPNAFARGLGLNTMKTVGIMCADISDPFFANAVYYLENDLRKNGYESILCCTGFDLKDRKSCLQILLSRRIDAVIFLGSSFSEVKAENMDYILQAAENTTIIMINSYLKHPNIYCIFNDDRDAIFAVVTKLLKHGREKILFIHQGNTVSSFEKLRGYKEALMDSGYQPDKSLIIKTDNDLTTTKNLLLEHGILDVDAVVATSDIIAVAFVKYAKAMGIRIPQDCNVIGYSNSLVAKCSEPELSSIDTYLQNMCLTAVSNLMRIFKKANHLIKLLYPVTLRLGTVLI